MNDALLYRMLRLEKKLKMLESYACFEKAIYLHSDAVQSGANVNLFEAALPVNTGGRGLFISYSALGSVKVDITLGSNTQSFASNSTCVCLPLSRGNNNVKIVLSAYGGNISRADFILKQIDLR